MKVGSLVVATKIHKPIVNFPWIYTCSPFYPTPSTVCTVKSLDGEGTLELEETEVIVNGRRGWAAFQQKNFKELQPPNENESVEEVKEILENSSVATV